MASNQELFNLLGQLKNLATEVCLGIDGLITACAAKNSRTTKLFSEMLFEKNLRESLSRCLDEVDFLLPLSHEPFSVPGIFGPIEGQTACSVAFDLLLQFSTIVTVQCNIADESNASSAIMNSENCKKWLADLHAAGISHTELEKSIEQEIVIAKRRLLSSQSETVRANKNTNNPSRSLPNGVDGLPDDPRWRELAVMYVAESNSGKSLNQICREFCEKYKSESITPATAAATMRRWKTEGYIVF